MFSDSKDKFNLKSTVTKVVVLAIFLGGFPVIMMYMGVDVINDCRTYTIADFEAAKSDASKNVEEADIGTCIQIGGSDADTSSDTYVQYFDAIYAIYAIVIVALIIVVVGYNVWLF